MRNERTTAASSRAARIADIQNRACQSKVCATQAESGRPIAPPTPSVALSDAIAVLVMCGGVTSRISAMPTGMNPMAMPCRARPASIGVSVDESAQTTEPTTRIETLATITRCLPYRSPSRPLIGIVTAAVSSVTVTTQPALATDVSRSPGRPGSG